MPDRTYNSTAIRYTFNGKEDEIFAEWQDYGFRNYDKRQRRFTSIDPLTAKYPELTPFQFASNRPIDGIDLDGLKYFAYTRLSLLNSGRLRSGLWDLTSQLGVNTYFNMTFKEMSFGKAITVGFTEVNLTSTAMATVNPQAKVWAFVANNAVANAFQYTPTRKLKTLGNGVSGQEFIVNTSLAVLGSTTIQVTGFAFSRSLSISSRRIANKLINSGVSPVDDKIIRLAQTYCAGEIGRFITGGNVGTGVANTFNNGVGKIGLGSMDFTKKIDLTRQTGDKEK